MSLRDASLRTPASSFSSIGVAKRSATGAEQRPGSGETHDEGTVSMPVDGTFTGAIDSAGDTDAINVTLTAGQTYLISLRGTGGSPLADSFLSVLNPSGVEIAFDDDGGNGFDSLVTITASSSGTYQIVAEGLSGSTGSYAVDVRLRGTDVIGDTLNFASPLAVGTTQFGFLETWSDTDVYQVTLGGGSSYIFEVAGGADYATGSPIPAGEIDTFLTLYDSAGNVVASNDDIDYPSDLSSGLIFNVAASGIYYVAVETLSDAGGYVLRADTVSVDIPSEGTVAVGGAYEGAINDEEDVDAIDVALTAGQTYVISLRGTGDTPLADTYLSLLDANGVEVAHDDDGGIGVNSLITFTATTSGTFQIVASDFPGSTLMGDYTIDVRQQGADSVGNTIGTTSVLALGQTQFGFLETVGDLDYYRITVTEGGAYAIEVAGGADYETGETIPLGEIDTLLTVYDSAGNVVATNDDLDFPDDLSSGLGFIADSSGTYYVRVEGLGGTRGGYALTAEEVDLDPLKSIDWGTQLPSNTVTVYFAAEGEEWDGVASLGWSQYEQDRVMAAFQTWADVTNLNFSVTTNAATATFHLVTTESDEYLGYFNPPGTTNAGVGAFAVNGTGWVDEGGLEQGGYAFVTLVHEIGHAIGLAHPHDDGGTSDTMFGVTGPFGSYGYFDLNQGVYTAMSYNDGWQLHPDAIDGVPPGFPTSWGYQGAPGAFDIAVVQQYYGADPSRHGGNTVYTLPTQNAAGTFFQTIWDTSGIDTIVNDGTVDARIDLTAATLDYSPTGGGVVSFVNGIFGGFTIANGVVIENATGGSGSDALIGNSAANLLNGRDGDDTLLGGEGNDTLVGGNGNDTITGGIGIDTASYADATAGVNVNLLLTAAQDTAGAGIDTINSVENLIGSAFLDRLTGNNLDNRLEGGLGADVLRGAGGNDVLFGGGGVDTASYANSASAVTVSLAIAGPQDTGGAGVDTLISMDSLLGSSFNDTLTGNATVNTLDGANGDDILFGGDGNDTLIGGNGNDTLDGGNGSDTASYISAASAVTINLTIAGAQNTGGAGIDTLISIENVTGSTKNDTLIGNAGNNTLSGGTGDDLLNGGAGNDILRGNAGFDTVTYQGAAGAVTVALNTGSAQDTGGSGFDTLSSIENLIGSSFGDRLSGNGAANRLEGAEGNDVLFGANGNDTLIGGTGNDEVHGGNGRDTLTGGGGADHFYFDTRPNAASNVDHITDFNAADDSIHLSRAFFTGFTADGTLSASSFVLGTTALDGEDRILYDAATGNIRFDADGVGGRAAILFATVEAGTALTNADFILFS